MIIPGETTGKEAAASPLDDSKPSRPSTPPPMYTPTPQRGVSDTVPPDNPARPSSPLPKPTNFVSITKLGGALRGRWVIDPSVAIPGPFLTALEDEETEQSRRNLYLKTLNGSVTAEIFLINRSSVFDGRPRVSLEASTYNGAVNFTLRELAPKLSDDQLKKRLPVKIGAYTLNGAISLSIPRSFRGIISASTLNGDIKLSRAVQDQVLHDKQDGGTRRFFLGQFNDADFAAGASSLEQWTGDEVVADTKSGHVKIRYEDEFEQPCESGGPGLISRWWNAIF